MVLAAVTCLFNSGDGRRLANYHEFAADLCALGIDLWTVEAIFPGQQFALSAGPRVFQYECGPDQVLWQKERLLNLAVARLPADVDQVCWLDADVLFDCLELSREIEHSLRARPVIQLWEYAVLLGPDRMVQPWPRGVTRAQSLAAYHRDRRSLGKPVALAPGRAHPGFAWAMRRETWDALGGLYEADLSGIADGVMAAAWLGAGKENPYLRSASPALRADALPWTERAWRVVRGQVGHLPVVLGHLYHGPIRERRYRERRRHLQLSGFDPARHVTRPPGQPLRWTSAAPRKLIDWCQFWLCRLQRADGS